MPAPPSAFALRALSRKYEALAELRRERARDGRIADRHVLRGLAREFPGALRELDTLAEDEIDRRARALSRAADEGTALPWMAWMAAYHATMRAALLIKVRVARTGELPVEMVRTLALQVSERTGIPVDDELVRAVARPPDGRLNRVVFQRLGEQFGASPDEIWEALFPARRPARY